MAMLSVKDLQVYYGSIHAIKGISFEVNEGEIVTLIGANGAGKTTTLHAICGLVNYSPWTGTGTGGPPDFCEDDGSRESGDGGIYSQRQKWD